MKLEQKQVKAWAVVSKEYVVNHWPPNLYAADQFDIFSFKSDAEVRAKEWSRNGINSQVVFVTITYLLPIIKATKRK